MLVDYVYIAFVVIVVCKYSIYTYNRVDLITIKGRFDYIYKLFE